KFRSLTLFLSLFFSHATATTDIYTLSLHDALPISTMAVTVSVVETSTGFGVAVTVTLGGVRSPTSNAPDAVAQFALVSDAHRSRSEEHTSELQSRGHLVCRLLLEKKKKKKK